MLQTLLSAALIFTLRVVDVSLATLRMLMVVRGQKLMAWIVGFLGASVFILTMVVVLNNLDNWLNILGYASGYATGGWVGMWLEERLAMGYASLRIISSWRGAAIAGALRQTGYAITEIPAQGKDGTVDLLICSTLRRDIHKVQEQVKQIDPDAFITAEDLRPLRRGYWGK